MQTLPPELSYQLLETLNPSDLASYSASSPQALSLCTDGYLWRQKIKTLSTQELQEDWFLPLAEDGERRLFSSLCYELNAAAWPIDEYAIALALIYISNTTDGKNEPSGVRELLLSLLAKDRRYYYFGLTRTPEGFLGELETHNMTAMESIMLSTARHFNYWPIAQSFHTQAIQRSNLGVRLRLRRPEIVLPSPSAYLTEALTTFTSKIEQENTNVLYQFLLPFLMIRERKYELFAFAIDLIAKETEIMDFNLRMAENGVDVPLGQPIAVFFELAAQYCDYDTIDEMLKATGYRWQTIYQHRSLSGPYRYVDKKTFLEIARLNIDDVETFAGGCSLQPDEFLDVVKTIVNDVTKQRTIIESAMKQAKEEGYTQFMRAMERLLKNWVPDA